MTQFELINPANAAHLRQLTEMRVGFITAIAWSRDGATLAVAHGGGVRVWLGGFGGRHNKTIQHEDAPVKAIALDPSGRFLATASSDTTVRLWTIATETYMAVLRGHTDSVDAVAICKQGRLIASGSADRTIRLIDLGETSHRRELTQHTDEITALDFIGSETLVSASRDGTVRLWETDQGKPLAVFAEHTDWVRALALSEAGDLIASASRDGTVRLWDVAAGSLRRTFAHDGDSRAVALSPDGSLLAADDVGTIRLWDVGSGAQVGALTAHRKPVLALAFHANGHLLVSGSGDNTVRLWGL